MELFDDMDKKTKLLVFPPVIGVVFVLAVVLIYPDPGMIAASLLFSLMVSVSPFAVWKYFRVKKIKDMEKQFPNFLRDLVEGKKSGLTLTEALEDTSKNEYGELNEEVDKMAKQLSWNLSFDEVMEKFSERVAESDLMGRTVKIIMEAKRSGGQVVSAMETVSADVSSLIEMEEKRKSKMSQHAAVMYVIYFMFVVITVILSKILVPMTTDLAGGEEMMIGAGGGVCSAPMQPVEGIICTIFESFALALGLGAEGGAYYEGLFMSMVLVQGIFSGLLIGQIRNNSTVSGFKHSVIMTGVGLVVYILAARYVTIEII